MEESGGGRGDFVKWDNFKTWVPTYYFVKWTDPSVLFPSNTLCPL